MKVAIFGASGYSGKEILQQALLQGHIVTVLTRAKKSISFPHQNLVIIEGNVLDRNTVAGVLKNQQAVIQCLGIGGKGNGQATSLVSDATKIIVDEMEKCGIKRLIAMSNVGAGNSVSFLPWFFSKIILPYFMKWLKVIIDDKNIMESVIMNSNLTWTIVRAPKIIDRPAKQTITATLDGKNLKFSITNPDNASFIVQQLSSSSFINKAPSISN